MYSVHFFKKCGLARVTCLLGKSQGIEQSSEVYFRKPSLSYINIEIQDHFVISKRSLFYFQEKARSRRISEIDQTFAESNNFHIKFFKSYLLTVKFLHSVRWYILFSIKKQLQLRQKAHHKLG
jgi:hypothetical protein